MISPESQEASYLTAGQLFIPDPECSVWCDPLLSVAHGQCQHLSWVIFLLTGKAGNHPDNLGVISPKKRKVKVKVTQ